MFILTVFTCCREDGERDLLARVYDKKLYSDELKKKFPAGLYKKDSIAWVDKYVTDWIQMNILLKEAENKLPEKLVNIDEKIDDYRKELILYELEKWIDSKNSDSMVSFEEIVSYYNENRKEFQLKKNIARMRYIKLRKDAPGNDKARLWFNISDSVSLKKLKSYCDLYAENYFFNDRVWLSFDDILKEIPIGAYDDEHFLHNNKKTILEDENFYYLIFLIDYRLRNNVSPLEFEINNIRNILRNKKRLQYVQETKRKFIRNAESEGVVTISEKIK